MSVDEVCCCCFSSEPVHDDGKGGKYSIKGDHEWKLRLMSAPCDSMFPCVCGCVCPCLTACVLRKEALNTVHPDHGMEHYQCFQGNKLCGCCCECCITCSRAPPLRYPCLCVESMLCPGMSINSSRMYLQHEYSIMSDPCDNRLIRFNNCMQCLSCICTCLACVTRLQAVEQGACIFDLLSCVVHSCTIGCMAAQVNDECEHRRELAAGKKQLKNVQDITGTA